MRRAVGLPEREGVLVREVEADSPAHRAGIREGDLIVEAGGQPIRNADDVYDALAGVEQSGVMTLSLVRGADDLSLEVSFGDAAASGPVH
jgi:serine protease Do